MPCVCVCLSCLRACVILSRWAFELFRRRGIPQQRDSGSSSSSSHAMTKSRERKERGQYSGAPIAIARLFKFKSLSSRAERREASSASSTCTRWIECIRDDLSGSRLLWLGWDDRTGPVQTWRRRRHRASTPHSLFFSATYL